MSCAKQSVFGDLGTRLQHTLTYCRAKQNQCPLPGEPGRRSAADPWGPVCRTRDCPYCQDASDRVQLRNGCSSNAQSPVHPVAHRWFPVHPHPWSRTLVCVVISGGKSVFNYCPLLDDPMDFGPWHYFPDWPLSGRGGSVVFPAVLAYRVRIIRFNLTQIDTKQTQVAALAISHWAYLENYLSYNLVKPLN